jgi:hypothetical protein
MFAPRSCNAIVHRIAQFGVVALEDEACVLWLENFLAFVTDLVASDISLTELLLMEVNFQKKRNMLGYREKRGKCYREPSAATNEKSRQLELVE